MIRSNKRDTYFCSILACLTMTCLHGSPVKAAAKTWTQQKLALTRKNYIVAIKYPVFTGSNSNLKKLNTKIREIALRQYRDAIKEHSSDRSRSHEPLGEFVATYDVEMVSKKAASLSCNIIDYTPDAATSSAEIQTLNYSLSPFEELKIEDLFKDGVNYKEVLKVVSLANLFATTEDAPSSCTKADGDFENFAIDKHDLVLFFIQDTPNEVIKVFIPIHQIHQLIDDSLVRQLWSEQSIEADEEPALEVKDLKKQLAIIAIGTYSRMINADPSNALAYRERGKWYHELDRAEVGAKDLEEAKRLSPE